MKTMRIAVCLALLLWSFSAAGQLKIKGNYTITGSVADSSLKHPIPFVTVLLYEGNAAEPKLVQMTKDDGSYRFDSLPAGDYSISLTFSGYFPKTVTGIHLDDKNITANSSTYLATNLKELAEVKVFNGPKKRQIEMVAGGYVYNAEVSKSVNNNMKDLLTKVPGIFLDRHGIKIQGNATVTVIIDGRTVQMEGTELYEYLSSQSGQNIATITVLTNPSAKSQAEGSGGIIEIKTKAPRTKGIISKLTAGASSHDKYNLGLISNYNSKNFATSLNARYSHTNMYTYSALNVENKFVSSLTTPYYITQTDTFSNAPGNNVFINLGSALNLHKNSSIATNIQLISSDGLASPHYTQTEYISRESKMIYSILNTNRTAQKNFTQQYYAVYTKRFKKPGTALTADFNYFTSNRPSDGDNRNEWYNASGILNSEETLAIHSRSNTNIYTANVDYGQPVDSVSSIYIGARINDVNKGLSFLSQPAVSSGNYQLDFNETISSGYVMYKRKIKTYALNMGLRAENTYNKVQLQRSGADSLYTRSYVDFFPNVSLYKTIGENRSLNFSYSRRINRPKFRSYASVIDVSNPLSKTVGNPYITPVYLNSFDLTYNKQWGRENYLSVGGSVKLISNAFDNFSMYDSANKQVVDSIINYKGGVMYSVNGTLSMQLTSFLSMSHSLTLRYVKINNNQANAFKLQKNTAVTAFYNASLIGNIGKTITLQLDGVYSSSQIGIQSKSAGVSYMNFSFTKSFPASNIDISADVMDVFNSNRSIGTINSLAMDARIYNKEETQIFSVGISWRFGKAYKTNARRVTPKTDSRTEDK